MNAGLLRILITAGPTREAIDPVRFLSNRSSGKMGYAIAAAAIEAGLDTTLISGPVALSAPSGAALIKVESSEEMFEAVAREIRNCDVFVMCAAVADYRPASVSEKKDGKRKGAWMLALEPTRDILATVPRGDRVSLVVGFAAETHALLEHAKLKMERKSCDILIANDVSRSDRGMESDYNAAIVIYKDGSQSKLERMRKEEMGRALIKIILLKKNID